MENKTGYTGAKRIWMIVAVLLINVTAMAASYGGNVVLPQKLTAMNAYDFYSLFATLSSMGMMIGLPLVGVLCSKFGTKTITITGILGMFVCRLLITLTGSVPLFAVLWALQGFCSGLFMAAPYSIMAELVTPQDRPKFYGFIAAAAAVGSLVGPYLTGLILEKISINAALLIWAVFAVIPVIVLFACYGNVKRPMNGKFDFGGILLLVLFVVSLVLWLNLGGKLFPFASVLGIGLPVLAVAAFVILLKVEGKAANPSVPIRMFKYSRFKFTFIVQALIVAYSTCIGAYGVAFVMYGMGQPATIGSTVTMPQTIVQLILSLFIGAYIGKQFKKRFRPFALLAIVCYLAGLLIFFTLKPDSTMLPIYIATGIGGIGQAISQSTFSAFFQSELPREEIGAAQGMYTFSSTGGSCIFIAICGACMNKGLTMLQCFLIGACFVLAALIVALIGFRFPKEAPKPAEETAKS